MRWPSSVISVKTEEAWSALLGFGDQAQQGRGSSGSGERPILTMLYRWPLTSIVARARCRQGG
jgi:hypothetical protein